METKTIKTKQVTDIYGISKVLYKDGRKTLAEISLPNQFNGHHFRTYIHVNRYCGVGGDWETMEMAKAALHKYFYGVFFGCVQILEN